MPCAPLQALSAQTSPRAHGSWKSAASARYTRFAPVCGLGRTYPRLPAQACARGSPDSKHRTPRERSFALDSGTPLLFLTAPISLAGFCQCNLSASCSRKAHTRSTRQATGSLADCRRGQRQSGQGSFGWPMVGRGLIGNTSARFGSRLSRQVIAQGSRFKPLLWLAFCEGREAVGAGILFGRETAVTPLEERQ